MATLIVSATRSSGLMLTPRMLEGRRPNNLTIVDLAVPRDVDPAVGDLAGVTLLDIDHLRDHQDRQGLTEALAAAVAMVEEATVEWQTWCRTREAVPLIADLRAHVDRQKEAELTRTMAQLEHLSDEDRAAVGEMAHRLVNKMFHHLAVRMKQAAADPELGEHYLEAARYLFQRDAADAHDAAPADEVPATHPVR
jgi:glutamyl-tRNA reductase